jgi:hypothetical protein
MLKTAESALSLESSKKSRFNRLRPRRILVFSGAVLAVAMILVVPALGFGLLSLPFSQAEKAPASVQLDFAELSTGAPAGMDPKAISGETRKIETAHFAGNEQTLWVAPTVDGGFCIHWGQAGGGCNVSGQPDLSTFGQIALPPGVSVPTRLPDSATPEEISKILRRVHGLYTVPLYIAGYVNVPGTQSIVAKFKDGTTTEPLDITWVSEPIDAGFFSYDPPANKLLADTHLVSIEALSASGDVLAVRQLSSDK